ncbi:bifunctional enzyme phytoene desaturase/synthetase [Arthrobacter crystallopoietes BAB-32]|uniref:Bifunctional enzyme phytoene desaturase/synthetase n=1 Tax=Arthrobacter crystallopoietes BAB-32 TaxID=1246476 RepID=N1V334_9MICC|nr:squalene/phytoene synthase family protein [Arthrobacter crystallopoietes]EMY32653.1 bifunctional enzyme phytoene desaturase/synthetase [Arthrobacter crystallopoietes BAB-32]
MDNKTQAELYASVAQEASAVVIRRYSSSFSLATRLLEKPVRRHVENIYALVRIADEIVDGASAGCGSEPQAIRRCLDRLEREALDAAAGAYSSNLVVHSFGLTAAATGIGPELIRPFFASMRTDLDRSAHSTASFDEYVYGSAEVVGLMCVRAFLLGRPVAQERVARLDAGARRLGAAFQKVNFLRDLADDYQDLGRSYFPGVAVDGFSEAQKHELLDGIEADLSAAAAAIPDLPAGSKTAVAAVHALFAELARRLRRTPAQELLTRRVGVPDRAKLRLVAQVWCSQLPRPLLRRRVDHPRPGLHAPVQRLRQLPPVAALLRSHR